MIRPRPRCSIPGMTARQQRYTPRTLTRKTRHQSAGASSHARASGLPMPAFAQSRSIGPRPLSTWRTIDSTESGLETSATTGIPPRSYATSSTSSLVRAATAMRAPARASSRAMLAPIPRPPPVTSATCPSRRSSAIALRGRLEQRVDSFAGRHRQRMPARAADDESVQRFELEPLAVHDVVVERRRAAGLELFRESAMAIDRVVGEVHALGFRERDDLLDDSAEHRP